MEKNYTEEYTIVVEEAGERIDKFLSAALPELTRSRVQALLKEGQVTCDGHPILEPSFKVRAGQILHVLVPLPQEAAPRPENIPLTIVYEDEDLLVLDKPAGLVVHPGAGNAEGTLVNALLAHCGPSLSGIGGIKRPGIVHRIDKDTSGLLVVAKNDLAHQGLSEQFAAHTVTRAYHAFVWGVPRLRSGSINQPIGRHPHDRQKMAVVRKNGKEAVTHYRVLKHFGKVASLIECRLETGRTHQIRVHMTYLGHPLISDPQYKGKGTNSVPLAIKELAWYGTRQALHAGVLGFIHPRHQTPLLFQSEYPVDLAQLHAILSDFS